MEQTVDLEDGIVTITWWSDSENDHEYDFKIDDLERFIVSKGPLGLSSTNYSEMIQHLLNKKWVEKDTLYRLAQLTVEHFPHNEIDWLETFKMVERHFYHKALDKHEKAKNPNKSASDSFFERIERGREERDKDEVEDGLEHVVKELLKKWKVVDLD